MINCKIQVVSSDFERAYKDYIAFSKKSIEDIANKTVFEVAKLATKTTKSVPKETIASDLRQARGGATLAEVIIAANRKAQGKRGLASAMMEKAVESLIKKRQRTAKFVASGWVAAVKAIAPYIKDKSGSPMPTGTAKAKLGGALPARNVADKASAVIWNAVFGGKGKGSKPAKVTQVELEGLEKAVKAKTADMMVYINKKLKEGASKFNR